MRRLAGEGCELLTVDRRTLDLRRQQPTEAWFERHRPDVVFLAAATVGGIMANKTYPAEFLYDNMMIAANTMEAARRVGVQKFVMLGSSCIYPKFAAQPIAESSLLTGQLEPTNEAYAVAKIAGLKLAAFYHQQYGCDFVSAQPCNLYGPGDNFDPERSHVLPALLRKIHEAKVAGRLTVEIWGTGSPLREFLHVDDLADGLVFLATKVNDVRLVNIGSGDEISIKDLALLISEVIGFDGELRFDPSKPDGTPRKVVDSALIHSLGWHHTTSLREGIASAYAWYCETATEAAPPRRVAS